MNSNSNKKRVFIFDDNIEILDLCKDILEDAGFAVKTSPTTSNIEKQVQDYMPQLIFMDNWLPDISGIEATKILKANPLLKHIPVIYFTANTNVAELASEAGAEGYLAKPFDITQFEEIVFKYL